MWENDTRWSCHHTQKMKYDHAVVLIESLEVMWSLIQRPARYYNVLRTSTYSSKRHHEDTSAFWSVRVNKFISVLPYGYQLLWANDETLTTIIPSIDLIDIHEDCHTNSESALILNVSNNGPNRVNSKL